METKLVDVAVIAKAFRAAASASYNYGWGLDRAYQTQGASSVYANYQQPMTIVTDQMKQAQAAAAILSSIAGVFEQLAKGTTDSAEAKHD